MKRSDRNSRTRRNFPSSVLGLVLQDNSNPPPDPGKNRIRRLHLVLTAAQLGVILLLVGVVGIFIWKALARYQ